MESIEKCKSMWKSAKSDTERIAALFIISKILKSTNLNEDQRGDIFKAIGLTFLNRLFHSDVDSSNKAYKQLAVALFSCFCSYNDIYEHDGLPISLCALSELIGSENLTKEDEPMVNDALDSFYILSENDDCREMVIESGIIPKLIKHYQQNSYGKSKVLSILLSLFVRNEVLPLETYEPVLHELINIMSSDFYRIHSLEKFELCDFMTSIFMHYDSFLLSSHAAILIKKGLTDILRSKVSINHRKSALKLAGMIIQRFGGHWFGDDSEENRLFFTVLVQLTCVEIQMLLEDRSPEEVSSEMFLLSSCFTIIETIIGTMIDENYFHPHHLHIDKLLESIKEAFRAIVGFLKVLSNHWQTLNINLPSSTQIKNTTIVTIRVLCSWLAEETFALQEEILEILPFILSVCREFHPKIKDSEPCIIRFLIAPLCHLTADDVSRNVLLQNGLLPILFKYIKQQWSAYQCQPSTGKEAILATICGIFLNIVVLEAELVSETDDFFQFLKFLFNTLPQLSTKVELLSFKANFSVLGLLITRLHCKRVKTIETSFCRFLSSSVKFLWDAHHLEESNGTTLFILTREYLEAWDDIMELWFLGMQALSSLLPLMPWIASFLVESGWPVHIISTFSQVSLNGLEGNVKSAYQALLSALVRCSNQAVANLNANDAIDVCRKHNLSELETLLQKAS